MESEPVAADRPAYIAQRSSAMRTRLVRLCLVIGLGTLMLIAILGRYRDDRRRSEAIQNVERAVAVLRSTLERTGTLPAEYPYDPEAQPAPTKVRFRYRPPASPAALRAAQTPLIVGSTGRINLLTRKRGRAAALYFDGAISVEWLSEADYQAILDAPK